MELDLGICTIRSWRQGDENSLVHHANDRAVWRNMRDRFPHPYTLADAWRWIELNNTTFPETNFAIAVQDAAVGGIGIVRGDDVHRRSAEIGYWLGRELWGRGIAPVAVQAVTEWVFAEFDLARIYAGVFEWNPASTRVLEKAGYTLEGRLRKSVFKDGQLIDQFLYAITRE